MSLYRITELNDEKQVVLITLYYLRSIYLYLGKPPFLTLTIVHTKIAVTYKLFLYVYIHENSFIMGNISPPSIETTFVYPK